MVRRLLRCQHATVTDRPGRALDASLVEYYEQEAALGRRHEVRGERAERRDRFIDLLDREQRHLVVDVGSGPGLDTIAFVDAGFSGVGLDLAAGNIAALHDAGLVGVSGSLYEPPFADGSFDAAWSMSTLVHVPDDRFDAAMAAIMALVRPGAPVAIGTWGGFDWEGISEFGDIRPYRFFSLRSHERAHDLLARHGAVESFDTWRPDPSIDWEYQFVVLRRR